MWRDNLDEEDTQRHNSSTAQHQAEGPLGRGRQSSARRKAAQGRVRALGELRQANARTCPAAQGVAAMALEGWSQSGKHGSRPKGIAKKLRADRVILKPVRSARQRRERCIPLAPMARRKTTFSRC